MKVWKSIQRDILIDLAGNDSVNLFYEFVIQ